MKNVIAILCILAGLGFAGLTLGAFAQANDNIPYGGDIRPLTVAKFLDGTVASTLNFFDGSSERPNLEVKEQLKVHAFARGFTYMALTILLSSIAALILSEPKSQTLARPGRRKGA